MKRARETVHIELTSEPVYARPRKLKGRWKVKLGQDINAFYSDELNQQGTTMRQIRVDKAKLLEIIETNRSEHRTIFLSAQKSFRVAAIKLLDAQLKAARTNKPFQLASLACLAAPVDHTADYDRTIRMLKMSVDDIIVIDEREFQNYVDDVWNWSQEWAGSNMRYVGSAASGINRNSRLYAKMSRLAGEQ